MELSQFKTVEQLAAAIKTLDMVTSVPWTDFIGGVSIFGWTSFTTAQVYYKKIGKLVFIAFYIDGTSDDVIATFTVPFTAAAAPAAFYSSINVFDNGAAVAGLGIVRVLAGEGTAKCGLDGTAIAGFTNENQKIVTGQFWYEAA